MRRLHLLAVLMIGCGGGGGDGGDDGVDAYVPPFDAFGGGPPITAPDRAWTWVDFPDSRCMNDEPTGIGVNLDPASKKVLIYLEGGGACFNAFTCAAVAHQNGFGAAEFNQVVQDYGSLGVFNRDDTDNPFRDWNMVFVPYCSGDVHAGLNESGMGGRKFVGYRNIGLYLERLSPTFPDAEQVVLGGASAGGFGAALNYDRVAQAFGHREVLLLDDSGPPMSDTYMTPCLQTIVRDAWSLDQTLPADCLDCQLADGGGLVNLVGYLGTKYPDRRLGLVTSTTDGVIRTFYGFGYPTCTSTSPMPEDIFAMGIDDLTTTVVAPYANFKAFVVPGGGHVHTADSPLSAVTSGGGVPITDWLRGLVDGGAGWQTVRP